MNSFGENINTFRKSNRLSQQDFADLLAKRTKLDKDISVQSISKWEKGEQFPKDIKTIIAIADLLEITLDELMRKEIEEFSAENNKLKHIISTLPESELDILFEAFHKELEFISADQFESKQAFLPSNSFSNDYAIGEIKEIPQLAAAIIKKMVKKADYSADKIKEVAQGFLTIDKNAILDTEYMGNFALTKGEKYSLEINDKKLEFSRSCHSTDIAKDIINWFTKELLSVSIINDICKVEPWEPKEGSEICGDYPVYIFIPHNSEEVVRAIFTEHAKRKIDSMIEKSRQMGKYMDKRGLR